MHKYLHNKLIPSHVAYGLQWTPIFPTWAKCMGQTEHFLCIWTV